jgi:hypothetical protein
MFIKPYAYFSKYDTLPAMTEVVLNSYFFRNHLMSVCGRMEVYNNVITVRAQQYPNCRNIVKLNKCQGNMFRPTSSHHKAIKELSRYKTKKVSTHCV